MGRFVKIVSQGLFDESYDIKDLNFYSLGWNDYLGEKINKKIKKIPYSINNIQDALADKSTDLAKLDVEEIKYDSQKYTILELEVNE